MSNYADLIERLRTASNTSAELDDAMGRARSPRTLRLTEAADAISRLEREKAEAIRMIRLLLDGIGHPTNDGWYMVSIHIEDVNAARDLLSRTQEQTA